LARTCTRIYPTNALEECEVSHGRDFSESSSPRTKCQAASVVTVATALAEAAADPVATVATAAARRRRRRGGRRDSSDRVGRPNTNYQGRWLVALKVQCALAAKWSVKCTSHLLSYTSDLLCCHDISVGGLHNEEVISYRGSE